VEIGATYLVRTNGAEWRDNDLHLWPAPLLTHHMRPEITRGRPVWVAKVTDPVEALNSLPSVTKEESMRMRAGRPTPERED